MIIVIPSLSIPQGVYVAGSTESSNFPMTETVGGKQAHGYDKKYNDGMDGFVVKLSVTSPKIPTLYIENESFDFENIHVGDIINDCFKIKNTGDNDSILNVSFTPDDPIIVMDKTKSSLNKNESSHICFSINTSNLEYQEYHFTITVKSNDSNVDINSVIDIFFTIRRHDPILSISPTEIDVSFTENAKSGFHKSSIKYLSNDPNNKSGSIPITITIKKKENPKPSIIIKPTEIKQECFYGEDAQCSFIIKNTAINDSVLDVKLVSYDAWLSFTKDTFSIPAGDKEVCFIKFHVLNCTNNVKMKSSFTIISNDPNNEKLDVPIALIIEPIELIIQLQIGNSNAYVQQPGETTKKRIRLDAPPTIKNGHTMITLRFIGETFGAKVEWDAKTQTITLRKVEE